MAMSHYQQVIAVEKVYHALWGDWTQDNYVYMLSLLVLIIISICITII